MANLSFDTGVFPDCFKVAQVTPILKKQGLDACDPVNYRPISNLHTLSKLLERLFLARLQPHQQAEWIHINLRIGCKAARKQRCSKLQVTFMMEWMTVECQYWWHWTSLRRLTPLMPPSFWGEWRVYFGVTGRALQWLSFYLTQRRQCVKVDGVLSPVSMLPSGVPQGSVLGPVLFSAFIAPLADVIDSFHISHHQYADDTNLSFLLSIRSTELFWRTVSECLNSVKSWFLTNGLLVNPGKSDSILIGTTVQTRKVDSSGVKMGGSKIPLSDKIKSLGVVFDQRLTFENHVKAVCRTCNFHIKSLRVLRPSLDTGTAEIIGRSIIMSRLDYCNSLLAFTSKRNIHRLQMVQNQLARVVSGSGYRQSAAPILLSLHWLPVQRRIEYKVVNMVFKSRMNSLPEYLSRGLTVYTSVWPTRSSLQNTYVVPRVRLEVTKTMF